jgi:hypothetical protein
MANIAPQTIEVSCQLCAQASLPLGKEPLVPIERRLARLRDGLNDLEKRKPKNLYKEKSFPTARNQAIIPWLCIICLVTLY